MKTVTKCVTFGTEEDFKIIQDFYLREKEKDKKLNFSKFVRMCIVAQLGEV